jgi:hypothetical protein
MKILIPVLRDYILALFTQMWWDGANFRPKWGLYRKKSPKVYQFSDWQLFQNVQIWKKN